jgi:hypothetical protein
MPEIKKIYRHYKGRLYEVIAIGKHADDVIDVIIYRSIENDQV